MFSRQSRSHDPKVRYGALQHHQAWPAARVVQWLRGAVPFTAQLGILAGIACGVEGLPGSSRVRVAA
eukprot:7619094-Alexandrium_andersonii.AAC.1